MIAAAVIFKTMPKSGEKYPVAFGSRPPMVTNNNIRERAHFPTAHHRHLQRRRILSPIFQRPEAADFLIALSAK